MARMDNYKPIRLNHLYKWELGSPPSYKYKYIVATAEVRLTNIKVRESFLSL